MSVLKWQKIVYDRPHKKGTILYQFNIQTYIGKGGYGIIYTCLDRDTNERYVLKQLRPSKAKQKERRQRFYSESRLLQTLNHPNIPKFKDYFIIGKSEYLVMQYIKGKNLEEILFEEKTTYSELDALILVNKLLLIVQYLHEKHIFHLDIRPPNLILNKEDIYLIDFGLAKQLTPHQTELIQREEQEDYYSLGECLLFILYSQFDGKRSKSKSWLEELSLSEHTAIVIKKLLGISNEYHSINEIKRDLKQAICYLTR